MNKRYSSVNNWLIDIPSGSIIHLITGERKRLGEYQLKLLNVFMQEAGRILTRDELTNLVWERRVIGNNSLPNAIHALRAALEDDGKKQRIIKTIPRKGYLLEPEYCRFIDKDESELAEPEDVSEEYAPEAEAPDALPETTASAEENDEDMPAQPDALGEMQAPSSRLQRRVIFGLLIILTALCSMMLAASLFQHTHTDNLSAQEIQANVYSNIRLYAIDHEENPTQEQDNLYSRLKGSLYILNQQLKTQSVTMKVYFLSENQTLNYTFALKSPCDEKQLVMTIYHWRIDPLKLNNLILRETRRKLDEMATCKES